MRRLFLASEHGTLCPCRLPTLSSDEVPAALVLPPFSTLPGKRGRRMLEVNRPFSGSRHTHPLLQAKPVLSVLHGSWPRLLRGLRTLKRKTTKGNILLATSAFPFVTYECSHEAKRPWHTTFLYVKQERGKAWREP